MSGPFDSLYFNSIGPYLKKEFGCRTMKLALDGGFTCPNRDGSRGTGGCIFCSEDGSGTYCTRTPSLTEQMDGQVALLKNKWPEGKYLAYFQSYTNTYAPVSVLRQKYEEALSYPGVIGLAIATRPDCLPPDVLELLRELNQRTYLWVELGLQTISDQTAQQINRCYPLSVFDSAMEQLTALNIRTVVHLIFGLPGETRDQMLASVRRVSGQKPFGLKLHLLHVLKNTRLAAFPQEDFAIQKKEEYINLVADALELIPPNITIHRLTGDGPEDLLLFPTWSLDKRSILNGIVQQLKKRSSFQGSAYSPNLPSL